MHCGVSMSELYAVSEYSLISEMTCLLPSTSHEILTLDNTAEISISSDEY